MKGVVNDIDEYTLILDIGFNQNLETTNVPRYMSYDCGVENKVRFSADTTNVMLGGYVLLSAFLKERDPASPASSGRMPIWPYA